jgi:putative inorganic carbon (hco3(-)) transporter
VLNKLKHISFAAYLSVICILLIAVSVFSIVTSRYVYIYLVFFIAFGSLSIGYFALNRLRLYKMLFFFIPLSIAVKIIGEAEIQIPTEPMIGILTLSFFAYLFRLKSELKLLLKNPIVALLLIEFTWMLVCSVFSELQLVSFKYILVRFCYIIAFFMLGIFWLKHENKPHKFFLLYAIGMILPIINGMIFHAKLGFKQSTSYIMPQPFFNDHTVYGACLAFIIPAIIIMLFYSKDMMTNPIHRILLILLLLFLLVAVYLSFSRAAWLSLGCSLVLYLLIRLKMSGKTFVTLIVIAGTVALTNLEFIQQNLSNNKAISNKEDLGQQVMSITNVKTDVSNKERVNRWKCAIRMGQAKPILGFGPRTYKFIYGTFQVREDLNYTSTFNGNKGHAHSDYLSYLAETGYPGFIIHILLYLTILYQGLNTLKNSISKENKAIALMALLGIFTYIIHGLFNSFMEDEKMASLVYMSMAMLVYISEKEKAMKNETLGVNIQHS